MSRLVACLLVVVLLATACATAPSPPGARDTVRSDAQVALARAACDEQARTGTDSETLALVLGSGFIGMLLVAAYGAAEGAHTAALTGGKSGDGAWIGAAAGAGVGALMGLAVGLKKAQEAKTRYESALDRCLSERRAPHDSAAM